MTASVVRRYRFEAAHQLHWHTGKCARLHGHSYVLEVVVSGPVDDRGVVVDFSEVDDAVSSTILTGAEALDHSYLNDILENPTAERVVTLIGERLDDVQLSWTQLRLWETEDGSVILDR